MFACPKEKSIVSSVSICHVSPMVSNTNGINRLTATDVYDNPYTLICRRLGLSYAIGLAILYVINHSPFS